jgi:3-oxoacyl-[acyl-carrier-protein] synthase-1
LKEPLDQPERMEKILFTVITHAIERSGLRASSLKHTGLFIGSSSYDLRCSEIAYHRQLKNGQSDAIPMSFTGYNRLGELICNRFGIGGDPFNINSACTSSANALLLAQSMLLQGRYQHALVVGIELFNETTITGFSGLQLIADRCIAPFDAQRDGILLGESCSAVILSAEETRKKASLYLLGGGNSLDPYSITTANPDGSTIAKTLEIALANSGVEKQEIKAIKTHGTATRMNDQSESRGIMNVFSHLTPPITAIKPYIGHTLGACGTLELVLFGTALRDGYIPKTPNFKQADPDLDLIPLTEDIEAQDGIYLLNFFGFGGSNTVIVMEKIS